MTCLTRLDSAIDDVARLHADAICIDFDRPDQLRLRGVQALKRAYPRLPLLLLTEEHSEALAIWALRMRAWNYFVKPVRRTEFDATVALMARFAHSTAAPRTIYWLDPDVPRGFPPTPVNSRTTRLVPALQYVLENFSTRLSEADAAALCGMSRFAFSRGFHAAFGMTFREHMMQVRLAEARRLIVEGGHSLTEVAYATGFNDTSYFTRMFRRHCGVLPSQYRDAAAASAHIAASGRSTDLHDSGVPADAAMS